MNQFGKIKDQAGNQLEVFNEGLSGGIIINDKKTGASISSRQVFVNKVPCRVIERKLGGFYIVPDSQEIAIKINWAFKLLLLILGIFSFGLVPLILHFVAFSRYPKIVNEKGLILKNGSAVLWEEIDSIVQNLLKGTKQALEFYPKDKGLKRIIVPQSLLVKKELFSYFFSYLKEKHNLKVIDKEVQVYSTVSF